MGYDSFTPEERAELAGHAPDYMVPLEVPVRELELAHRPGVSIDIVLFGCTCGAEPGVCSWQVEIERRTHIQR